MAKFSKLINQLLKTDNVVRFGRFTYGNKTYTNTTSVLLRSNHHRLPARAGGSYGASLTVSGSLTGEGKKETPKTDSAVRFGGLGGGGRDRAVG